MQYLFISAKNIFSRLSFWVVLLALLTFLPLSFVLSYRAQAANGINKVINFQGKVTNSDGTNVADGAYDFVIKLYDGAGSGASTLFTESWTASSLWSSTMSSAPSSAGESLTYTTDTNESTLKVGQILWNTTKQESVIITSVDTSTNTIGISPTRQAWAGSDTVTNKIYVKDGVFKVAINALNQDLSGVNFGTDSLFLGINFNADGEMKPRIQYTATPYAFNAEKVNGLTVTNTSDNPVASGTTLKIADNKTVVFNAGLTFSGTDGQTFTFPSTGGNVVTEDFAQSLTNKTIGSTGLTFSGATTDITTGSNEDLVILPNGSGRIGLGTTSPQGFVDIFSGLGTLPAASLSAQTTFAALLVDNGGLGDIFTASNSGATRFTIGNTGVLTLANGETISNSTDDTIILGSSDVDSTNGSGVLRLPVKSSANDPSLDVPGNMYYNSNMGKFRCYQGGGWIDCIPGVNIQSTEETTTDTLSASETEILSVAITPSKPTSQIWIVGSVEVNGDGNTNRTISARIKRGASCAAGTQVGVDMRFQTDYTSDNGVITLNFVDSPGTTASTTYRICAVTDAGSPTATNKSLTVYEPAGGADATAVGSLTVREADSSPSVPTVSTLEFGPASSSTDEFVVANQGGGVARISIGSQVGMLNQNETITGNWNFTGTTLGIGTTVPQAKLHVVGGNDPVASISAASAFAGLVVDNTVGDIFAASASGMPRFAITNEGGIKLGTSVGTSSQCITGGTTASWGTCGSSQWIDGGGGIYYNSGNVALGTTDSSHYKFFVNGTTNSKALGVFAGDGNQDLLTASISGTTKFVINQSGNVLASAGLASKPSYSFIGDTATGIFEPASGNIGFTTAGTEKLRIWNNGFVSINTDIPSATFHVTSTLGTIATASISARSSFAGLVVDNTIGDILTASASGLARFTLTNSGGIRLGTSEGNNGECIKSGGAGNAATWGTCGTGGSSLFTADGGGVFTYLTDTAQDLLLGGSTVAGGAFYLDITDGGSPANTTLYLGTNGSKNGVLSLYSSTTGKTATISNDSTGNLTLAAATGASVIVGSGTGDIIMSLTSASDVFTADKTFNLASDYTSTDFTFKRVFTGGANRMGGALFTISDESGGTGTIDNTLLLVDSALTSGTFTGKLASFQLAGIEKLKIQGTGTTPVASVAGTTSFAGLAVDNTVGDIFTASASGLSRFTVTNQGGIKLGTSIGTSSQCLVGGTTASWSTCGASSQWSDGTGGIYYNSGNVAIGTTDPSLYKVYINSTGNSKALEVLSGDGNQDLLTASVSGVTKFVIDKTGNVGVGTTSLAHKFTVSGAVVGKALALFNDNGDQDILTASHSGTSLFSITKDGGIKLGSDVGDITKCLLGGTTASWGTCPGGSGGSNWTLNESNGTLSPDNNTLDVLLGGTATTSAKFAFLNMVGPNAPTASISAGLAGGTIITSTGNIQTTAKQSLTLGGGNTGNIVFSGFNTCTALETDASGTLLCGVDDGGSGGGIATIQEENSTVVSSANIIDFVGADFTVTNASTGRGLVAIDYANSGITRNSQAESITGGWSFGTAATTFSSALNLPGSSIFTSTGLLGIGTTSPLAKLHIDGGNTPVASVSARSAFAALVADNTVGDIFSASASGLPRFTITNQGGIKLGTDLGTNSQCLVGGVTASWSTCPGATQWTNGTGGVYYNSGNVAVGTTDPSLYELFINGTGNSKALGVFAGDGNQDLLTASVSGTTKFIVDKVGNVGIGTTSPTSGILQIVSPTATASLLSLTYTGTAFTGTNGMVSMPVAGITSGKGIQMSGTVAGPIGDFSGSYLSIVPVKTKSIGGTTVNDSGNFINLARSNTVSLASTYNITGDVLKITSNCSASNGGVCTDSSSLLSLNQQFSSASGTLASFTNNGQGIGLSLNSDSGGQAALVVNKTQSAGDIFTASSSGTSRFVIQNNGNVGIGTFAPNAGLQILGTTSTTPTASISARGSFAGLVVDNTIGDLFTASSSGLTRFVINKNGAVGIGLSDPTAAKFVISDSSQAPGVDLQQISATTGVTQSGVDGLQIDYATGGSTNSAENAGLRVNVTSGSTGTSTTLEGIYIGNLTGAKSNTTEYGLRVGTGWDTGILVESGGITISGGSLSYSGSSRPTKTITLSPEFPGAIITASNSASNHTGSMTSDASASAALSNFRTYYEWTSTTATPLQDYTVAVRVTLPKDFSDWDATSNNAIKINFNTALNTTDTNKLDVFIYNTDSALTKPGNPVVYRQSNVSATGKVWTSVNIDRADLIDNAEALTQAGQTMVIYLKMSAKGNSYVQVGDIVLNYLAGF